MRNADRPRIGGDLVDDGCNETEQRNDGQWTDMLVQFIRKSRRWAFGFDMLWENDLARFKVLLLSPETNQNHFTVSPGGDDGNTHFGSGMCGV